MFFFLINLNTCKMCIQLLSFCSCSICIKERTYTSRHQNIEDPFHCLFLYHVLINDTNHGCQFLYSVVFPPWNPSSHTYVFGMKRSLACHCYCSTVITGVGDVPIVLRVGVSSFLVAIILVWFLFHLTFTNLVGFQHFLYVWRAWCMAIWSFDE
jgi:hypothetical protein